MDYYQRVHKRISECKKIKVDYLTYSKYYILDFGWLIFGDRITIYANTILFNGEEIPLSGDEVFDLYQYVGKLYKNQKDRIKQKH